MADIALQNMSKKAITKRIVKASNEPAFLSLGTEVSAKYKGAFCEAKVKKIVKASKIKVQFQEGGSAVVTHDDIVGPLKIGCTVDVKLESGETKSATISKITDQSMYTVVFDDGDENTLRRTQLCLKSEKHFLKYDTLDELPLTHPEHFGTPVLKGKSKKRRSSPHSSDSESDEESDEPAPRQYPGRLADMVGKVLLMTQEDRKKTMVVPVLVVEPNADTTELRTRDHLLVKSFKDSKFYALSKKESKEFTREAALRNDDKTLKAVYEKALLYYDAKELPPQWDKDDLFGSDSEDGDEDVSSDDEQSEEKDMFVAQLYKFMDERGTPINKAPLIGSRDLNLYRLFRAVHKLGGYNRVTNQMKWRLVYSKMGLPSSATAANQIRASYKRYLHAFEDFYRKLGSTMGTNITRPSRSRHSSGRTIPGFRERDRPESLSPKSPRGTTPSSKKEGKKEDSAESSPEEKKEPASTKSVAASPDCKPGRKQPAESGDAENASPSKRKTRAGVEEKAPPKPVAVKEAPKKPVKVTEDEVTAERDDVKKKRSGKRKSTTKSEEDAEKTDDTETDSHKSETDSTSGDKNKAPTSGSAKQKAENLSYTPGSRLKVRYGKGKNQKVYEAKVLDGKTEHGCTQWLVHYAGWNNRYDEWVKKDRVVELIQRADAKKQTPSSQPKPSAALPQRPKATPLVKKKSQTKITPKTPKDEKEKDVSKSQKGSAAKTKPPRPTRSTSLESSLASGLSPRKRPRRNSGHTEVSEQVSDTSSGSDVSDDEEDKSSCGGGGSGGGERTPPNASPRPPRHDSSALDKLVQNKDFDIIKELSIDMDFDKASQDSLERELNLNDPDMPALSKTDMEEEMDIESIFSCFNKDDYQVQSSENESIQSDAEKRTWRGRSKARSETAKPKDVPVKNKPDVSKSKAEVVPSETNAKQNTAKAKTEPVKPKADTTKAKTEAAKPKIESAKTAKSEAAKAKDDTQKSKTETPKPKLASPKPKLASPKPKAASTESVADSPKAKLPSPKTPASPPKAAVGSPKTTVGSPKTVASVTKTAVAVTKTTASSPKSKLLTSKATSKTIADPPKNAAASPKAKLDQKVKVELERVKPAIVKTKDESDKEDDVTPDVTDVRADTEPLKSEPVVETAVEAVKEESAEPLKEPVKDATLDPSEKAQSESPAEDQSAGERAAKDKDESKNETKKTAKGKGKGKRKIEKEDNADSEDEPIRKKTRRRGKKESESKASEPSCDEGSSAEKSNEDAEWFSAPDLTATPKLESEDLGSADAGEPAPPLSPVVEQRSTTTTAATTTQEELSIDLRGAMQSPNKPQHSDKPRSSTVENTPPSTPPEFTEPEQPSPIRPEPCSENASTKSELEANLEVESYLTGALPPGGQSPAICENSNMSTASEESNNLQQRFLEEKAQALATLAAQSQRKRTEEMTSAHRKRKRKVTGKHKADRAAIASDGDEDDHRDLSKAALSEPPKLPRGPSKYNFIQQLEEGKYLEGEARVNFLLTKIADLRSIYMQLKQEVASIDRRRKRQRKKQRLAAQGLIGLESALH